jgi:hypothetical protein
LKNHWLTNWYTTTINLYHLIQEPLTDKLIWQNYKFIILNSRTTDWQHFKVTQTDMATTINWIYTHRDLSPGWPCHNWAETLETWGFMQFWSGTWQLGRKTLHKLNNLDILRALNNVKPHLNLEYRKNTNFLQ